MKTIRTLVLLLLLPTCCLAQTNLADSLRQVLHTQKQDTNRVNLLLKLTLLCMYSRPDTAIRLAQEALTLANKTAFVTGQIRSLNESGTVARLMGNYPKALQLHLQALKKAEATGDRLRVAVLLMNIGIDYSLQGNDRQAIGYTLKALIIAKAIPDQESMLIGILNLGDSYEKINRLDSALFYTNMAFTLASKAGDQLYLGVALGNLGNINAKAGKQVAALRYYRSSLPYFTEQENEVALCEVYLGMATLFLKQGTPDSSRYYAQRSLTIARKGGFVAWVMKASLFLTRYYTTSHQVDSAFAYQSEALLAKDSLFSQEKQNEMQRLSFAETLRQQELEDARQQARTELKFKLLMGGLFTLLTVAFLLYRNNRQKHRANRLLQGQKEEIDRQRHTAEQALTELKTTQAQLIQREKMASLGELTAGIAHEIQNPLNFVNNFSEVSTELVNELETEQQRSTRDSELEAELLGDLKQNLQKINHHGQRASSIVKGMLGHSRMSTGERQPTDLNALADECLRLSCHGLKAKDKEFTCELMTDFAPDLGLVNVVPQDISRVLFNLFNNAFYAVNQQQKSTTIDYQPTVTVSTKQTAAGIDIRVGDNGTGIPKAVKGKIFQPFFTTKPTGEGIGLGLSLAYDIITKGHGGELKMETQEGAFTEFVITFKPADL